MMVIEKVTGSDGRTYPARDALDWQQYARNALPDVLTAHLRASGEMPSTTSVVAITFRDFDDELVEERHSRMLFTSYTESFIA